jgi:hypothetical protein|tara:strand:+ start:1271 stop:1990 length:720 start_codon:yes stop_codon:yes gene_type:complete
MKKYLICSGDSFTDANFRSSWHPEMDVSWPKWPELLAEKLDMQIINLGRSGQGNEYILSSIQDTIESIEDKNQIGLIIAGWSQAFRIDYQESNHWRAAKLNIIHLFHHGDIFGCVRKSLRLYKNFEYICEYYNIPYLQFQMIPLYIYWLRGKIDGLAVYVGNPKIDERKIQKILMEYDDIINQDKFMGWPITRELGGYNLSEKIISFSPSEGPYIISKKCNHPNAEGQEKIAEYIYDWL